uniref:Uncharacterized protein n=1 Tax=Tanacetum cinerariifolium TaxID=118510 RepID=A0A699T0N3_TANCI|nr:hypothetical protein [Tanacetum cinerariifolium]
MGYKNPSITPETKSDEVTESNAENLLSILSKCDVTLEDEIECDMPAKDDCSLVFTTFSNPLFKDNNDLDSSDDESLPDEDELLCYILQSADECLNPVVVLDWFLIQRFLQKSFQETLCFEQDDLHYH